MWTGLVECWCSGGAHNVGHVHGRDQLPQGVVVGRRHGHHVVLELGRVSAGNGTRALVGVQLDNLYPTLKKINALTLVKRR